MNHPAQYFQIENDRAIRCLLCPHHCLIKHNTSGFCRDRKNIGGSLRTINYGEIVAEHIDPVEKKPLYHFHPGSSVYSIGNNGCNLSCIFCQNWEISQVQITSRFISPENLVSMVKSSGVESLAFTYAEPMIWFEYVYDCAQLLRENSIRTILVTNGMINPDPLMKLLPLIDAMNIDIKSMDELFYKKYCHGHLAPVLETARAAAAFSHIEITNLIIPDLNDKECWIEQLAVFIAENLGVNTPLHLSRYHPAYKLNLPMTPESTMDASYRISTQYLPYVYLGNVRTKNGNHTFCPECQASLIERYGYSVKINLDPGKKTCPKCGTSIPIVFS